MTDNDRNQNGDGSIGWVSVQELANLRAEMMRELDKFVWPERQSPPGRQAVLKFFDNWFHRQVQRAKLNYEQFLPEYQAREKARERVMKGESEVDGRGAYEARLASLRGRAV